MLKCLEYHTQYIKPLLRKVQIYKECVVPTPNRFKPIFLKANLSIRLYLNLFCCLLI